MYIVQAQFHGLYCCWSVMTPIIALGRDSDHRPWRPLWLLLRRISFLQRLPALLPSEWTKLPGRITPLRHQLCSPIRVSAKWEEVLFWQQRHPCSERTLNPLLLHVNLVYKSCWNFLGKIEMKCKQQNNENSEGMKLKSVFKKADQ